MFSIEEVYDPMESFLLVVVTEHFRMGKGITLAKISRELHLRVLCVVWADKTANEPDDYCVSP